jgi:predicted acylesterase/phospholipase RssA
MSGSSENTVYFLSGSGGAFRGAVQYWVFFHLVVTLGIVFVVMVGTSVASINLSMFAQHKWETLLEIWNGIKSKRGFLHVRWFHLLTYPVWVVYWFLSGFVHKRFGWSWPIHRGGFYTMTPVEEKLEEHVHIEDFKVPFVAHVISANTGKRYQIDSREVGSKRIRKGTTGSSCMAPMMRPPFMQLDDDPDLKGKEMAWDGGYRDIFPPIPQADIDKAREEGKKIVIHAVGCVPRERVERIRNTMVQSELSMALRAVSLFEAEIYDTDILQLMVQASEGGEVHVWYPARHPGKATDARYDTIQDRLQIGKETVEAGPVILPGLAALPPELMVLLKAA